MLLLTIGPARGQSTRSQCAQATFKRYASNACREPGRFEWPRSVWHRVESFQRGPSVMSSLRRSARLGLHRTIAIALCVQGREALRVIAGAPRGAALVVRPPWFAKPGFSWQKWTARVGKAGCSSACAVLKANLKTARKRWESVSDCQSTS